MLDKLRIGGINLEELLKEQRKTNELLETILNTKQNKNLPCLIYAKEIAEKYQVNLNKATSFCKKYGTNFGGYCIEVDKFKEVLQTKGIEIFD